MTARPGPITVSFNDPDEFLAELGRDLERIDRKILRVTVRRRYGQPFVTVAVLATAAVGGTLVKLEHRVGECFAGDERATGLANKTQTALDRLTVAATALGLDVRAGVFE